MTLMYFILSDAQNVLDSLAATLFDYKNKMGNTAISSCQENEIRERHHWAMQNLQNVEKVSFLY